MDVIPNVKSATTLESGDLSKKLPQNTIYEKLIKQCTKQNITLKELHVLSGIRYDTILSFKIRNTTKHLVIIGKLAKALKIDCNYFLNLNLSKISERIKYTRVQLCLETREFAKLLGVSHDTVMDWEHGRYMPSEENTKKIDKLFENTNV